MNWANWIQERPVTEHERLMNVGPPTNMLPYFQQATEDPVLVTRRHEIATTVALGENSRNEEMLRQLDHVCAGMKRNYLMFKGLLDQYKALNAGAALALTNIQSVYQSERTEASFTIMNDIPNQDDIEHAEEEDDDEED
jgi:hypothetical protein